MIHLRAALPIGLLIVPSLIGLAAASPRVADDNFWALEAPLPIAPHAEGRLLRSSDSEAAEAAIAIWMEERKGVPTNINHPRDENNRSSWILPAENLRDLDDMLRQYGKVSHRGSAPANELDFAGRGASQGERHPTVRAMIDANEVVARRNALQNEIDGLNSRANRIPNILLLASAFATTLDQIAEAKERYDASAIVNIEVTGPALHANELVPREPGLSNVNIPSTFLKFLPDSYGENPGAVRIPKAGDSNADYLSWNSDSSTIDELHTLKISVVSEQPEITQRLLDAELKKLGALPSRLKPAPTSDGKHNVYIENSLYPALPLTGYLIPQTSLEMFRALAASKGRIAGWIPHTPESKKAYTAAYEWERTLARELRDEKDRLSSSPQIRSLVLYQLRRLRVFAETYAPSRKMEFLALEILEEPNRPAAPNTP